MKSLKIFTILILTAVIVSSCMPGIGNNGADNPAGFFMGIWHGWIAPLSLILGFFNDNINIYECYNTGWWYDFGFYMAIISGFGGLSIFRKNKKDD